MNVKDLKEQIVNLYLKINEIQTECSHPKSCLTIVSGANTGNWCEGDDTYWYTIDCSLCEKHWNIYSDDEDYKKYSQLRVLNNG